MKKYLLLPLLALIVCAVGLTSCDDGPPRPPYDPTYLDADLVGQWDLIYINGSPVSGYQQNFFDFYSNGSGRYYYYENGAQYWEPIKWYCIDGYSYAYLHVDYSSGPPLECRYWFSSDYYRLYMSWTDSYGRQTQYVYQYTGDAPAPRKFIEETLKGKGMTEAASSEARPGVPDAAPQIAIPK